MHYFVVKFSPQAARGHWPSNQNLADVPGCGPVVVDISYHPYLCPSYPRGQKLFWVCPSVCACVDAYVRAAAFSFSDFWLTNSNSGFFVICYCAPYRLTTKSASHSSNVVFSWCEDESFKFAPKQCCQITVNVGPTASHLAQYLWFVQVLFRRRKSTSLVSLVGLIWRQDSACWQSQAFYCAMLRIHGTSHGPVSVCLLVGGLQWADV